MTRYYKVQENHNEGGIGLMPKSERWSLDGFDVCSNSYFFAHDFFEHNFLDTLQIAYKGRKVYMNPDLVEHELVAMGHAFYFRQAEIDFMETLNSYLSGNVMSFPAYDIGDFQCGANQFSSWTSTNCYEDPRMSVKRQIRNIAANDYDHEENHFDVERHPLLLNYIMYWVRMGFNMAKRKYAAVYKQSGTDQYSVQMMFNKLQKSNLIEKMEIFLFVGGTVRATMNFSKMKLTVTRLKDRYDEYDYEESWSISL